MSILPVISSTSTQPAEASTHPAAPVVPMTPAATIPAAEWTLYLLWATACLVIAKFLGVFRRCSVAGPDRLAADDSGVELIGLFGFAYFVAGLAGNYFHHRLHVQPPFDELISEIAGALLSFSAILIAIHPLTRLGIGTLRLKLRTAPLGIVLGMLTIFILYPLISLTSGVVVTVENLLHLKPPDPHAMLQMLGSSDSARVKTLVAVLAVIVAPVYEETLFRGLLQTALSRFILTFSTNLQRLNPGSNPDSKGQNARSRWIAIILTSALFAAVHLQPAFFAPLFVLAIGLGYSYERTGNLWVSITAHGLFNAAQISMFLLAKTQSH